MYHTYLLTSLAVYCIVLNSFKSVSLPNITKLNDNTLIEVWSTIQLAPKSSIRNHYKGT